VDDDPPVDNDVGDATDADGDDDAQVMTVVKKIQC